MGKQKEKYTTHNDDDNGKDMKAAEMTRITTFGILNSSTATINNRQPEISMVVSSPLTR